MTKSIAQCSINNLSQEKLMTLLDFDVDEGVFTWRERDVKMFRRECDCKTWNTKYAKTNAGWLSSSGYICIKINKKTYYAHRLAWLYVFGYMPNEIDHINGIKHDNRISNIRDVDRIENMRNCKRRSNNNSGVTGVFFDNKNNYWVSYIENNYKRTYIGYFKEKADAITARKKAEIEYGFHKNHDRT